MWAKFIHVTNFSFCAVNKYSRVEYLSMLGVFGSLISAVQLYDHEMLFVRFILN